MRSLTLILCAGLLTAVALGVEKSRPTSVEDALRAGWEKPLDRRAALDADPPAQRSDASRWQAGYVKSGKDWVPFETAQPDEKALALQRRYETLREKVPNTAAGHIDLATWCRKNNLASRERGHLVAAAALADSSLRPDLMERAGYRRIGGQWVPPEQAAEWQADVAKTHAAIKKWGQRLSGIADQLSGTGRRHEAGVAQLGKITDAGAVPAIEYTLCGKSEATALAAVQALAKIDSYEATTALARQAVFNAWQPVRTAATEGLLNRRMEDFVPDLIPLLVTPVEQTLEISERRGVLVMNLVMSRETENQFEVSALSTVSFEARNMRNRLRDPLTRAIADERVKNDLARRAQDEQYAQQKVLDEQNERTDELNARVSSVLASVSGEENRETPRDWWDWWGTYNDYEKKEKKVRRIERRRVTGSAEAPRGECFAAGTPVWTNSGAKAIQEVRVGDLVLSQDIETGELGYNVVVTTTVQPPKPLMKLTVSGETLQVTSGHRFWHGGQGWRRTKDFKAGDLLHTARGTSAVESVEPGETAPSYNLVVAGTHVYFVGQQALLSHDVTLPRSTNRKSPGLR